MNIRIVTLTLSSMLAFTAACGGAPPDDGANSQDSHLESGDTSGDTSSSPAKSADEIEKELTPPAEQVLTNANFTPAVVGTAVFGPLHMIATIIHDVLTKDLSEAQAKGELVTQKDAILVSMDAAASDDATAKTLADAVWAAITPIINQDAQATLAE